MNAGIAKPRSFRKQRIRRCLRRASLSAWVAVIGAFPLHSSAQVPSATLKVRGPSGTPIPHAVLTIEGSPVLVADDSGRITFRLAQPSVRITVRRLGYLPFVGTIDASSGVERMIDLVPVAQRLSAVTVVEPLADGPLGRTGFYDRVLRARRGAFNADFITPEELEERRGARLSDVLQGRRFVFPQRTRGGVGQTFLIGRGGCKMTVYLDGQLVQPELPRDVRTSMGSMPPASRTDPQLIVPIDDIVPASTIAAVEIYASAANAPAEMIPLVGSAQSGACGIVAIWTGGRH